MLKLLKLFLPTSKMAWGGLVAALAAVFAFGLWVGVTNASNACKADKLTTVERAIKQAQAVADENYEIELDHVLTQANRRAEFRVLRERAKKHATAHPELNDCSLDADGLQFWIDANRGRRH
ncbi:hypothetical protein [Sulfuriflexus mobilis]|uniref:hypothetical protein n=1 Tax=Sulfuriflexus mobilis TaxID=1811807 RepID=UPI000F83AEE8|nr:hypothetical protein [Sulfuriflexus mobilis]